MQEGYLLEWLDTMVFVTLNPGKTESRSVLPEDLSKIQERVVMEKNRILANIKSIVFSLNDDAKIKCLVKNYHASLIVLLDQALEDRAQNESASLKDLCSLIIDAIDEILYLIDHRFTIFLNGKEPVPVTFLPGVKNRLGKRLSDVSNAVEDKESVRPVFDIIMREIDKCLSYDPPVHICTFGKLFYLREFCDELQNTEYNFSDGIYTCLDIALIRMNFNSTAFIRNLIRRLSNRIDELNSDAEKIERLLFYHKQFKQLHRKPGKSFNASDASMYKQIDKWFSDEISYVEKQAFLSVTPIKESAVTRSFAKSERQKILTVFSVDQMALILRAADDLRMIKARSLNSVFKNIVPHLSTPNKDNISYDSMRSKSYSAETGDKQVVIDWLKQMIQRIAEF